MPGRESSFKNNLRVRACGLMVKRDAILLAQILSPVTGQLVWMPPGGGLKFGESLKDCLRREFFEETHLRVDVGEILHVNELIAPPFHALEFYLEILDWKGEPRLGCDPEFNAGHQYLKDLRWISIEELRQINFAPVGLASKIENWGDKSPLRIYADPK